MCISGYYYVYLEYHSPEKSLESRLLDDIIGKSTYTFVLLNGRLASWPGEMGICRVEERAILNYPKDQNTQGHILTDGVFKNYYGIFIRDQGWI